MSINQQAIELLENNRYEDALKLFQKAVDKSRDVQSLTNLAWMYCYEEEEDTKAMSLLEETIIMKPSSHMPYNLLGEIYIRKEKWSSAKGVLSNSISIHPTKTAYNNLAIANYHIGNLKEASKYFLMASEKSDNAMYSHVKCLIELGDSNEAIIKLGEFSENNDKFVGDVEVADLYVELGRYQEAIKWFEKGWKTYWKQPNWVSRYVYSLLQLNDSTRAREILNEAINQKLDEIKEAIEEECDDDWLESDKQAHINELLNEKVEYEQMINGISSGHIPTMEFDTFIMTGCYLFGCARHNHPEYDDKQKE
ncbi:tetratricopeptide repeat protein [Psychrobacillus sp. NPDC096426]|uniref:tetratricopeptide repeat protein n=1 Tax=Psychrobacillus sp. NPDC096426 TaxID=3364491 RepID=UPI003813FCAE